MLCACAAVPLLVGCGKAPEPVPQRPTATPGVTTSARTVTRTAIDMLGRTVGLPETVTKVVALSPSAAEFASALGLEVVGRSSDTPETVALGAGVVGSAISPDFTAVAALSPDLVIGDAAYHSGRTRDFDRLGLPVFVLKATTFGEVLLAVDALGLAAARPDEAAGVRAAIANEAVRAVDRAKGRATGQPAPRVLVLTGGGRDVFSGSETSYLGDLVKLLGGVNVVADAAEGGPIAGFGVIDIGEAARLKPDVVLILSSGQGGLAAQIRADSAWSGSVAVRNGRLHELDTTLYLRAPGPRVGEAMDALVGLLWP